MKLTSGTIYAKVLPDCGGPTKTVYWPRMIAGHAYAWMRMGALKSIFASACKTTHLYTNLTSCYNLHEQTGTHVLEVQQTVKGKVSIILMGTEKPCYKGIPKDLSTD